MLIVGELLRDELMIVVMRFFRDNPAAFADLGKREVWVSPGRVFNSRM